MWNCGCMLRREPEEEEGGGVGEEKNSKFFFNDLVVYFSIWFWCLHNDQAKMLCMLGMHSVYTQNVPAKLAPFSYFV